MRLYRFRIVPESPWLTPWQADTLSGMLCWACARKRGSTFLTEKLLEPALMGQPNFVVSDAFPGDWLPLPVALRLQDWPPDQRTTVKRARWVSCDAFHRLQRSTGLALTDLITANGSHQYTQVRNTLGRQTNTTSEGGSLFSRQEWVLERGVSWLTLYVRLAADFESLFEELLGELAHSGFGADASVGKGQFHLDPRIEPVDWLDEPRSDGGCATLSTFQPGPNDPPQGYWEAFTKYGKLGPGFGMDQVFKRPLLMLRPGACFDGVPAKGWLGRSIHMDELLSPSALAHFCQTQVTVAHLAFGLAVPMPWQTIMKIPPASASATSREEAGEIATAGKTATTLKIIVPAECREDAEPAARGKVQPSGADRAKARGAAPAKAGWYSLREQMPRASGVLTEIVTLLESPTARGNARVRTEGGEEMMCRNFPVYPKLQTGERFLAEITRQEGKPARAVFRRMS